MRITQILEFVTATHQRSALLPLLLVASFPWVANGQLSGEIRDGKLVVIASQSTEVHGVDLISQNSLLEPIPSDAGASPFQLMLSNSPRQITWGNLGAGVRLHGEWATQAGYTGTDVSELKSTWGKGANILDLPITIVQSDVTTNPSVPVVETPTGPSLSVSLNAANRFVLHANDYEVGNLIFDSPSGGLVPAENASPFSTLISNDANNITYFSPDALTLDGTLTLSSGWNGTRKDLRVETFRDNALRMIHGGGLTSCVDNCPTPTLDVSFDDDQRFVLHGNNHQLTSLDFYSNGSLVPAESPAPFANLESNSERQISYRSMEGVTIDGTVTLSSRWNANGTVGDVRYEYADASGNSVSRLAIPNSSYAQNRHLDAIVNDDNRIVLSGTGHRVNAVGFSSRSGSLVPGSSSAPFDSTSASTVNDVAFFHSNGNIILDGQIMLDVGWNPDGQRDLQFQYEGVGNTPSGGYYLSRGSYPTGTEDPRPDVWVSLDRDYKLILHADEKQLVGVNVESEKEILLPAGTPDPFQALLSNSASQVTAGVVGLDQRVNVVGSIKTDIGVNPLLESEALQVSYGEGTDPILVEVLESDLAICPGCAVPEVSFVRGGQMLIEGFESPLAKIEVTSASGSLIPLTIEADEFAVAFASDSSVRLAAAEGVDAFLRQALPVAWNTAGIDDVLFEFTTIEGTLLGPFVLGEATYEQALPEPSSQSLIGIAFLGVLALRRQRSR